MASSKVSLSGMVSGMDTDAIVKQLVDAYSIKKDNLVKAQTKLEWKQDAWKTMNTKIYGFYSGKLSTMRFSSAFSVKKASSSSTKATVSAGADAPTGTQKLKIKQLATSGYLTGGQVKRADSTNTEKLKGSSTLSELGITEDSSIAVKVNGETKNITLSASDSLNQAMAKLKSAGVNANFDENNQRFFISSKTSGSEGDFSVVANNTSGNKALRAMGLNLSTASDVDGYRQTANMSDTDITNAVDTDWTKQKQALYDLNDTDAMDKIKRNLQSTLEKATSANENLVKANESNQLKLDAVEEVRNMSFEERSALYDTTKSEIDTLTAKGDSATEEEKERLFALTAKNEVYLASTNATFHADGYRDNVQEAINGNNDTIDSNDDTILTLQNALADDAGFEAYINNENTKITESNDRLKNDLTDFYNTKRANAQEFVDAYDLVNTEGVDQTTQAYRDAIAVVGEGNTDGTGAVRIEGQDAIIELNGATFHSTSNNFQINGLTISANTVTEPGEEIAITTNTDVDGIYDMIKGFFKDYNEVIKEMDTKYNAASAKGYEPLLDEEKEAMSDSEVEKWETKIKDALLRKDQTLNNVMTSMTSAFMKSYDINGKTYSLASFGIATSGYLNKGNNEQYTYHIDGDKDDSKTSGNADKLKAAIAADPEGVSQFFNKLADGVYSELSKKMRMTSLSSAYTVYNDKKLTTEYNDYKTKISDWEDKIDKYEEKYRKQFAAMEKAMAQLQSSTSALAGMLG